MSDKAFKEIERAYVSDKEENRLSIAHDNAQKIISDLSPLFVRENEEFYTCPKGLLEVNGHLAVGEALQRIEGKYCTPHAQTLVLNYIKNLCLVSIAELEPGTDLIPVKNGIVHISTGEITPYEKGMTFAVQHPIVYDPKARCYNFLQFLKEIIPDPLKRRHILESFARCFDRKPSKMQAEVWVGERDTGKTTLLRVLGFMLGMVAICSETLQNLTDPEDRWATSGLYQKNANLCDELPSLELVDVDTFKRLTGGGIIRAEFKGKQKFDFQSYAKLFFTCNNLPKITSERLKDDLAFFERFFITYFERQFSPEEFDDTLVMEDRPEESKLINQREISGLFNICLGILREMRQSPETIVLDTKGLFGVSTGCLRRPIERKEPNYAFNGEEIHAIWFHQLHHKVDDFVALYTVKKEDGYIVVSDFKERVNHWLRKKRREAILSDREINVRMEEKFGPQVHGGKRRWKGLVWRDEANSTLSQPLAEQINNKTGDGLDGQSTTTTVHIISDEITGTGVGKNPSNPSQSSFGNTDFDKNTQNPVMDASIKTSTIAETSKNLPAEAIEKSTRPKFPSQVSGNCSNQYHESCGGSKCLCKCHTRPDLEGAKIEKNSGEVLRRCKAHPEELMDEEQWRKHIADFHKGMS